MRNRRNQILMGILLVQIVLVVVVLWPSSNAATAQGTALFPDLTSGSVTGLTVQDTEGKKIELAKQNGSWGLPNADDYPADSDKVKKLIDNLGKVRTDRVIARTSGSHKRLKVAKDDYERLVTLTMEGGAKHEVYIGSSLGARASYVRSGDGDEVYLANDVASWQVSTSATSWIDPVYLKLDQPSITRLVLKNANGSFEFTKDDAGKWTMTGLRSDETLDESKVTSLVSRVSSLRMSAPLGKEKKSEYGMDDPAAVVTVTLTKKKADSDEQAEEKTVILRVGETVEDSGDYVVQSSESAYYVRVASYNARDFVTRTRSDFIKTANSTKS